MTHMKTTVDLPDELLIAAKQVAARRRTTLKEMLTRSLRREIGLDDTPGLSADSPFEIGPLGLPVLKKRGATPSLNTVQDLIKDMEEEELQRALKLADKS